MNATIRVMPIVRNLTAIAAERALGDEWEEHPMFGIEVDGDAWAAKYQEQMTQLQTALDEIGKPHASALDEDEADDFEGPGTAPRASVGSEPEASSADGQRAAAHAQEDAPLAVEAPLRRRGPRRFNTRFVADLVEEGQEICVARGGRGGIGNAAMKSLPNR